ncbi:MAG TPA: endonuclease/exonuclease/phosphatase family protein [Pyrinomonadaceae bacterium]|nr:endonuclease/exonuclease/phosphatase family protein [Pyrinomonadaceae bacterium]
MPMPAGNTLNISADASNRIETGEFARPTAMSPGLSSIIVASYNIRYAVGSHLISGGLGRRLGLSMPARRPRLVEQNLQRAAEAFADGRRLPAPQILALQEADKETVRSGGHHVARELAEKLGMHYALTLSEVSPDEKHKQREWYLDFEEQIAPSETGRSGVALLHNLPFTRIERLDLPWHKCAWRPRLAIKAEMQLGPINLQLFNSHIDPHATLEEQIDQHKAVLAHADDSSGPLILLGDFNTLSRQSCHAIRAFLESKGFRTPFQTGTATWRSGPIRLHTDWIFVRDLKIKRYGVARRLSVSDHWPVWAEIELG